MKKKYIKSIGVGLLFIGITSGIIVSGGLDVAGLPRGGFIIFK